MFNPIKKKWLITTSLSILFVLTLVIFSCSEPPVQLDFKAIPETATDNHYLVCPPEYCNVDPQEISPVYPLNIDTLDFHWQQVIANEEGINTVEEDLERHKYTYLVRGTYLPLSHVLNVEFIAIDDKHATLAVHYKSKYSYIDFDPSKQIIQDLLAKFHTSLSKHSEAAQ